MRLFTYICCIALVCAPQNAQTEEKTSPQQEYLPQPHFLLRNGESPEKGKDLSLRGNVMNIAATKENPLLFGDEPLWAKSGKKFAMMQTKNGAGFVFLGEGGMGKLDLTESSKDSKEVAISKTTSEWPIDRALGAWALQWQKGPDVQEVLLRLCVDPCWLVKRYAAWALGLISQKNEDLRLTLDRLAADNAPQENDSPGVKLEKQLVMEAVTKSQGSLGFTQKTTNGTTP